MIGWQTFFAFLAIVGGALVVRYVAMHVAARNAMKRKEAPVVPHWIPFVGHALQFGNPATRFACVRRLQELYGPCFQLVLMGRVVAICGDADLWKVMLRSPGTSAGMGESFARAIERSFHPHMSKLEAHSAQADPVHMKRIRSDIQSPDQVLAMTVRAQAELVACTQHLAGTTQSLWETATTALLRATVAAFYGPQMVGKLCDSDRLRKDMIQFDQSMALRVQGVPRWMSAVLRASDAALGRVKQLVVELTAGDHVEDQIQMIAGVRERIRQRIANATALEGDDEMGPVVMLWVAVVNSFGAVTYTLWHVAHDRALQERIYREVSAVAGANSTLSTAALQQLPLIDSCISETLRLHNGGLSFRQLGDEPVETVGAKSTLPGREGEAVEVRQLPAKLELLTMPKLFFCDERRFANPDTWIGDRFVGDKARDAMIEMVFGGGAHLCPGRHFVRNEIRQLIASLVHRFELELVGGSVSAPMPCADALAAIVASPISGADAQIAFKKRSNN
jgi:cytochrome P450